MAFLTSRDSWPILIGADVSYTQPLISKEVLQMSKGRINKKYYELLYECKQQCPKRDCHYVRFNYRLRQQYNRKPGSDYQGKTNFEIAILSPGTQETIFEHKPAMKFTEYLSMVGGLVGLYFGLSLTTLLRILRRGINLICQESILFKILTRRQQRSIKPKTFSRTCSVHITDKPQYAVQ